MTCLNPTYGVFPCGKCSECLKMERLYWSIRMDAEMRLHDKNSFLTLTYDDEHLPVDKCLSKERVQKFFKDFRNEWKVRYFLAGEYGEDSGRPHYHVAAFGIDQTTRCFSDLKYDPVHKIWRGRLKYWPDGHVAVGTLTNASINYISKYILKKLGADQERDDGRTKEFRLMSLRPGLGADFLHQNEASLKARGTYVLGDQEVPLPRYFIDRLFNWTEKRDRSRAMEQEFYDEYKKSVLNGTFQHVDLHQLALNKAAVARLYGGKKGSVDTQNQNTDQDRWLSVQCGIASD